MESVDLDDDEDGEGNGPRRPRQPPPVQPPQSDGPQRQVAPSVNVVEAAKPTFHIVVGDPHKVGDLTSAHTEYNVDTKVYNFIRYWLVTLLTQPSSDHLESLPNARVLRFPPLPRFSMAIQSASPK